MRVATTIARIVMGFLFLFASITYFLGLIEPPPQTGAMKTFDDGLRASVYIMPTVKLVELLCGLAFVVGRFVPLATVLIAPIVVNIVGVHVFLAPEGLPIAVFLVVAWSLVAYHHRASTAPLFRARADNPAP